MCGQQKNAIEMDFTKVQALHLISDVSHQWILHPTCSTKIHAEPSHLIAIQTQYKKLKLPPQ